MNVESLGLAVGERFVADRDPQPVQCPPVEVVAVVAAAISGGGQSFDPFEKSDGLEEGMSVGPDGPDGAHKG